MRWKPSRRRYWDLMIYLDRRRKRRRERSQPQTMQILAADDGSFLVSEDGDFMETF